MAHNSLGRKQNALAIKVKINKMVFTEIRNLVFKSNVKRLKGQAVD